jgi:serine/threonine protein kinase HipA of HipAB toxin-antitoxin module
MGRKQPTAKEISEAEADAQLEASYGGDPAYEAARQPDGVAFDYQVIEDENILKIFEENPWLAPIRPNFSRLMFLTHMTAQQALLATSRLERKVKRLKYSRKSREEKILLESLYDHFCVRINDSVKGSKITTLATNRRILQLERREQKRGFLRR